MSIWWGRTRPPRDERGVALVEFALIAPVLMMLVVGMLDAGVAYNQKQSIGHAAREGARYGAILPTTSNGASGPAWAAAVAQIVRDRANGDLAVPGATVCVALVTDVNTVFDTSGTGTNPYGTNGSSTCYNDGGNDTALRVQVLTRRPATISAVVFTMNLTLTGRSESKFEST